MYPHLSLSRGAKRLAVLLLAAAAGLMMLSVPAQAASCPNDNFALISATTDFEQSKDHNGNELVCRSRDFVMPPPATRATSSSSTTKTDRRAPSNRERLGTATPARMT